MKKGIATGTAILLVLSLVVLSSSLYFVNKSRKQLSGPIEEIQLRKYCMDFVTKYECNARKADKEFLDKFDEVCKKYLKYKNEENSKKCIEFCGCDKFEKLRKWGEKIFGEDVEFYARCNPELGYCEIEPSELFFILESFGNQFDSDDIPSTGKYIEYMDPDTGKTYYCFSIAKDENGNKKNLNLVFDKDDVEKVISYPWFLSVSSDELENKMDSNEVDEDDFVYAFSGSFESIKDLELTKIKKPEDFDFFYWDCAEGGDCSEREYFRILIKDLKKSVWERKGFGKRRIIFTLEPCPVLFDPKDYSYMRELTVKENAGKLLQDYVIEVTLDTKSLISHKKMRSDCHDIRIVDDKYKPLEFFVEPATCGTTSTHIWVKIPHLEANEEKKLYLFYGNSNAKDISSNPRLIFLGYDENVEENDETQGIKFGCTSSGEEREGFHKDEDIRALFYNLPYKPDGIQIITKVYIPGTMYKDKGVIDDFMTISLFSNRPGCEDLEKIGNTKTLGQEFSMDDIKGISLMLYNDVRMGFWFFDESKSIIKIFINGVEKYSKDVEKISNTHIFNLKNYKGHIEFLMDDSYLINKDINEKISKDRGVLITFKEYGGFMFYKIYSVKILPYIYPEPTVKLGNEINNPKHEGMKPCDECWGWSGKLCGKELAGNFLTCESSYCTDVSKSITSGCKWYECYEDPQTHCLKLRIANY